jgi:hypothetical protein
MVYNDCKYSVDEVSARNQRVAEFLQMKEEVLRFVEANLDQRKVGWVKTTLFWTSDRVQNFYKGVKADPEGLLATLNAGCFPYERCK